jgi:hypothetical protein
MVHARKHATITHPPHNIARNQNVVFDVFAMGGNVLPCCQMVKVVFEEGVGHSKVKSCNQVKQIVTKHYANLKYTPK